MLSVVNRHLKSSGMLFTNEIRMGIGIPDIMVGCGVPEEHENIIDYFSVYIDDELWKGMMPMVKTIMETLWAIGTSIIAALIFLLA